MMEDIAFEIIDKLTIAAEFQFWYSVILKMILIIVLILLIVWLVKKIFKDKN